MEEIFAKELDDVIMSTSAKKNKKNEHNSKEVEQSASPVLKGVRTPRRVSFDPIVGSDGGEDEDIFGDSFNGSALDKMMSDQDKEGSTQGREKKKKLPEKKADDTSNKSCPKTPNLLVS